MSNRLEQVNVELTSEDKMARGSAWMAMGNIGSRLLGVAYILPWYAWLGENQQIGNALFSIGYTLYSLFIMVATAGIPSAIAKQVAYHNSRDEYKLSKQILVRGMQLMAVGGGVSAALMYFLAPFFSQISGGGADLIPVLRSLSIALLIIPMMSVIRGYFQGIQSFSPFAISQLVEQVVRVAYILAATFVIMKIGSGNYLLAIKHSTFAAFMGALAGLIILLHYFKKERTKLNRLVAKDTTSISSNSIQLLLSTAKEAVPFVILGAGVTIYKLWDQITFVRVMGTFTEYSQRQLVSLMALFNSNPDKLSMVVIGLATSMIIVGLPMIAESFAKKETLGVAHLISHNLQLYLFLMMPATFGMIMLAYPLNTLFFSPDPLGANLLIAVCLSGLIQGLFMVTAVMLQGIYQNKAALIYFTAGLVIKIVIQTPSIYFFESFGPIFSTTIGLGVTCYMNLRKIHQVTKFNIVVTLKRGGLITLMTLMMTFFVAISREFLGKFLSQESQVQSFVLVILVALVGGYLYLYLALKLRFADKLLGSKMLLFRQKLHIK